jgi:hypothetical protein
MFFLFFGFFFFLHGNPKNKNKNKTKQNKTKKKKKKKLGKWPQGNWIVKFGKFAQVSTNRENGGVAILSMDGLDQVLPRTASFDAKMLH